MALASLVQSLFAGLVHPTTGAELSSCVCRFYQIGTLTPATVFSDVFGAQPITQPVILSAAGTAMVFITDPCRLIVKDAIDSTTIYDISNFNNNVADSEYVTSTGFNSDVSTTLKTIFDAWNTSAGGSAGFWQLKQASTATERNVKDVVFERAVSAKDYGALGNDAAADGAALAAAIVAANAGPKKLFIPQGTYRISAALLNSTAGLVIEGAGSGLTIIKNMGTTTDAFTFTALTKVYGVGFSAGTSSTGRAIGCDAGSGYEFRDIAINGHEQGIQGAGLTSSILYNVSGTQVNTAGATDTMVGGPLSASVVIAANVVSAGSGWGMIISAPGSSGCVCFGCTAKVSVTATVGQVSFSSCSLSTLQVADGAVAVDVSMSGVSVTDNRTNSGRALSVATGAGVVPVLFAQNILPERIARTTITATGGAGTVSINSASGIGGLDGIGHWDLVMNNTSGGNVTWDFAAGFFTIGTGGNPVTATGTKFVISWTKDALSGKWIEASRSV